MAMDILLQNGANPDDIVFTRHNSEDQEWGQAAFWECVTNGHIKLLEVMLNRGFKMNANEDVPENLHEKVTLLFRALKSTQEATVRNIVN